MTVLKIGQKVAFWPFCGQNNPKLEKWIILGQFSLFCNCQKEGLKTN
jgi:hypothetical protein